MITFVATAFALIAFAANSLLCRMALDGGLIDPVSFTSVRLVSGAIALFIISRFFDKSKESDKSSGSWISGISLFVYAAAFSLAYVTLSTGTGALMLFGAVQVTMISRALQSGEQLGYFQWSGLVIAVAGLTHLLLPGISAPDPIGALLMCVAGIAWGVYSIRGKKSTMPVAMTAGNFRRSAPFALLASVAAISALHLEWQGIFIALVSGVVTSGIGYVLWYIALPGLRTSTASIVQLIVPVLATVAGILFLSEELSLRLIVSSILILGGIAMQKASLPSWKLSG